MRVLEVQWSRALSLMCEVAVSSAEPTRKCSWHHVQTILITEATTLNSQLSKFSVGLQASKAVSIIGCKR